MPFSFVGVVATLFIEFDEDEEWVVVVCSLFVLFVLFEDVCLSFGILFEDKDVVRGDEEGDGVEIEVDCPF